MSGGPRQIALAVAAATVFGCGDDQSGGEAVRALFEVPRGGAAPSEFYALPFPNDIRVGADGSIDMVDHPRPNDLIDSYVEVIAARQRGFSLTAPSLFRFDGAIDPATLPATPQAAAEPTASVYLIDIDPDSPRRGEMVPALFRFEPLPGEVIADNWLSVLPYPGFVLAEQTTYAAVVTRRVHAADGSELAAGADLAAIAGDGTLDDPDLARARDIYQPLWDWLDEPGGDERTDVVSAAVFTTQDATSLLGGTRDVIAALPAPVARDIVRVADNAMLAWYDGVYDAPNFQTGDPPYSRMDDGGDIAVDGDGVPIVERTEALRFSFTVPPGTPPVSGWPVVIYAHGTGGDYHSFQRDGTAGRLAAVGIAAVSIDQVLHGPRNPNESPEVSFFNFLNPLAARDNTLQGALDDFSLVRLVQGFEHQDVDAGRQVKFDPDRILFFGHSQGGLTGVPFLAHEPAVTGAVLSGAGGLLTLSLLHKTEPLDIASLVGALIRDVPLDEFNPVLGLLQMWMERSDPAVYARYLIQSPRPGNAPKHVFQSLGITDRFTPIPAIEALAVALGVEPVAPVLAEIDGMAVAGRTLRQPPVSGNVDGTTAVLLEYGEDSGSDGHFVLFDIEAARTQSIQFLSSLAETGEATVVTVAAGRSPSVRHRAGSAASAASLVAP